MILKINCNSSTVNLGYTVFSHFLNMNDPVFSSTQGISTTAFLCIACMTCFLTSGSKKAMMQFFWL